MAGIDYTKGRANSDQYHTPPKEIVALLPVAWPFIQSARSILEPSAGRGHVGAVLRSVGLPGERLTEIELDGRLALSWGASKGKRYIANTLALNPADFKTDLVIGNPPYVLAEEFVLWCLAALNPGGRIFFLLRSGFTSGVSRYEKIFSKYPATSHYLVRRPSFVHKRSGTDKRGNPRIIKHDQFSHAWIEIRKDGTAGACTWLDNQVEPIKTALTKAGVPIPHDQLRPYFPGLIDEDGNLIEKARFTG